MEILAHRANGWGELENSRKACVRALDKGVGLELDVRSGSAEELIISHDAAGPGAWPLPDALALLQKTSQTLAFHLKDPRRSVWEPLAASLSILPHAFLFDVTLDTAEAIRHLFPSVKLGFSVADSRCSANLYSLDDVLMHPACDVIWWDEWFHLGSLYSEADLLRIRQAGKKVYAISPELHASSFPRHAQADQPEESWALLKKLGVDGICTDFPERALKFLKEN